MRYKGNEKISIFAEKQGKYFRRIIFCFDKKYIQIVSLARTMRLRDAFWMPLG